MELFNYVLIGWTSIAVIVFFILFLKTAPYGRYTENGWGIEIPSRLGWVVMESPAIILVLIFFIFSTNSYAAQLALISFWCLHYFHRSFIWPFRAKISNKGMPISIALFAIIFNLINGSIQGLWIFSFSNYSARWITSPEFLIGSIVFILGMFINISPLLPAGNFFNSWLSSIYYLFLSESKSLQYINFQSKDLQCHYKF